MALVAPLAWSTNILLVARQCSWYVIEGDSKLLETILWGVGGLMFLAFLTLWLVIKGTDE